MYIVIYCKDKNSLKFDMELTKFLKKYKKIANHHTTFSNKEYEEGDMIDLV